MTATCKWKSTVGGLSGCMHTRSVLSQDTCSPCVSFQDRGVLGQTSCLMTLSLATHVFFSEEVAKSGSVQGSVLRDCMLYWESNPS